MWYPLYALTNTFVGYLSCIILFLGVYYANIFNSQNFPFLSQLLFYGDSNSTYYHTYNQSAILNPDFTINETLLHEQGIPWLTGSYLCYLITSNMGLTATFTHMLLWNFDDIRAGWSWAAPSAMKKWFKLETFKFWANQETPEQRLERKLNDESLDPHYRLMLQNLYDECPQWWWGAVLIGSFVAGIVCLYSIKSTLPWWGFILANVLTAVFMLFFGAQYGLTGFQFNIQPICQMLAGYLFPGKPLASKLLYPSGYLAPSNSSSQISTLLATLITLFKWARCLQKISDWHRTSTCHLGPLSLCKFLAVLLELYSIT